MKWSVFSMSACVRLKDSVNGLVRLTVCSSAYASGCPNAAAAVGCSPRLFDFSVTGAHCDARDCPESPTYTHYGWGRLGQYIQHHTNHNSRAQNPRQGVGHWRMANAPAHRLLYFALFSHLKSNTRL